MENFQLSLGWGKQGKCEECGIPFLHTYPFFDLEYRWEPGMFFSKRFCTQECANTNLKKRDENEQKYDKERKQWG